MEFPGIERTREWFPQEIGLVVFLVFIGIPVAILAFILRFVWDGLFKPSSKM